MEGRAAGGADRGGDGCRTGEVYDDGKVRLEVTASAADTDGALHEMRATYAPGSPLPPAHLHPAEDERFEVLDGTPPGLR